MTTSPSLCCHKGTPISITARLVIPKYGGSQASNNANNYRGTARNTPHHVDKLDDNHPVNRSFFWYCEEGGEIGLVHDLQKAKRLVSLYSRLNPPECFEIIEVAKDLSKRAKREFLGFDLCAGYNYSLLSWKFEVASTLPSSLTDAGKYQLIYPLLQLLKEYFKDKLNSNGLFDDHEIAEFCLDCMMALQSICPGLWENEDVKFEIIGLRVCNSLS